MVASQNVMWPRYHGKVRIFWEGHKTLLLSTVNTDKNKAEISQNFVAFSEYTNFTRWYRRWSSFLRSATALDKYPCGLHAIFLSVDTTFSFDPSVCWNYHLSSKNMRILKPQSVAISPYRRLRLGNACDSIAKKGLGSSQQPKNSTHKLNVAAFWP